LATLRVREKRQRLVCEVKAIGQPRLAREACLQLLHVVKGSDDYPRCSSHLMCRLALARFASRWESDSSIWLATAALPSMAYTSSALRIRIRR
jgi:hypothetical protein